MGNTATHNATKTVTQSLAFIAAAVIALVALITALSPASALALTPDDASQSSSSTSLHPAKLGGAKDAHPFNTITIQADAPWLADNETLLARYADRILRSSIPGARVLKSQALPEGTKLSAAESRLFKALKTLVCDIAIGKRTSTSFSLSISDLNISEIISNRSPDRNSLAKVVDALLIECPYELYWYDKETGMSMLCNDEELIINMAVNPEYQGENMYTVSTDQSSRIKKAVAKAESIVKSNANKDPYGQLQAYKNAICNLVTYDFESAAQNSALQGDPWQVINVFDGDPSTNVVCEGYSKAFAYLCDLGGLADVSCYTVNGLMVTSDGSEGHMWNIVRMDDGNNYLVDVANCDEGSIGAPNELFLAPKSSGTVSGGYTFDANGQKIMYLYSDGLEALLGAQNLTVSSTPYLNVPKTSIAQAKVVVKGSRVYNAKAQAPKAAKVKVTLDGTTLKPATDYTVTYENAKGQPVAAAKVKAAGKYKVVVKGRGAYKGVARGTFTIKKAANPAVVRVSSKSVKLAKVKTAAPTVKPLSVTGAKGKVTYKKVSGSNRLTVNKTTGKVKVKKGTKADTYRIKVKVSVAGNANFRAKAKTVTAKVTVR